MKEFTFKKKVSQLLLKSANAMALQDTTKACPMFAYQPKCPLSLKKNKK